MVQKRGNLRWRSSERFSLEALRGILGVPKGKLTTWSNFRLRAVEPAVAEVSALSDYTVEIEPIKAGRSVTHVELRWWRKDGEGVNRAGRALEFASPGRLARAAGRTEVVAPIGHRVAPPARPEWLDRRGAALRIRDLRDGAPASPGLRHLLRRGRVA